MIFKTLLVIALSANVAVYASVDETLDTQASGQGVVLSTIEKIESAG